MPRLRDQPIGAADIDEYLVGYSDFSFEVRTLRQLRQLGLLCKHGGLYEDPVTKKWREFDIRATERGNAQIRRYAIECKNLRENFPLLVMCVPRTRNEAYNEVAVVHAPIRSLEHALPSRAEFLRVVEDRSIYPVGSPVGKSFSQVGRSAERDSPIVAADTDVFDKWSQALASADDLVSQCYNERVEGSNTWRCSIFPVVVVPDGRLWMVEYDQDGNLTQGSRRTNRCSFFVGKSYEMDRMNGIWYTVSHLEIVTSTGLSELVRQPVDSDQ